MMDKVPVMISGKDLDYIKDMLNWNFIAVKKTKQYLNQVNDEDVNKILDQVSELHKKQYNVLLEVLEQGGQNGQQ